MALPGVENLKHIVVLMMENRSFDHVFGYMMADDPRIDGVDGSEFNLDTNGEPAHVQPKAAYQKQLQPDPGHYYPDVDLQINGEKPGDPKMSGFVKAYYQKQHDAQHSRQIMYCFKPGQLPVITTLGKKFAIFNRWFSSLPGPTLPNRAFAHFGTSFGNTSMTINYIGKKYPTIYERMQNYGRSAKIYYFDQHSGTIGMTSILKDQPALFGTLPQFLADCRSGNLPDYSFIEPNYADEPTSAGVIPASDQHPDHNMLAGEQFIAQIYMAILNNEELWNSTALLIVYDEHGGIYDHVVPPDCKVPDEFIDKDTGFKFDRLGVRVPAVLISPWVPAGTVISGRVFEHASIPATVTSHFLPDFNDPRSPREANADTFLDFLSLPQVRPEYISFSTDPSSFDFDPTGRSQVLPMNDTPVEAAEPSRKLSDLIAGHVRDVHEVELTLPPERQTHRDISQIETEAQASAYIAQVMGILNPQVMPAVR